MLKNNNKDVIKRLNRRMLKQNKIRNFVIIATVILTTFMFTTIFTLGFSVIDNIYVMLLRGQGNKASISLEEPTNEQIEKVKSLSTVEAAGIRIYADVAKNAENSKNLGLVYYDEIEFEKNFLPAVSDLKGTYPEKENEIMLSKAMLNGLSNEKPSIGDEIELLIDGKEASFVLSGFYTGYSTSNPALISKKYCEKHGFTVKKDGELAISAKHGRNNETLDELEDKVTISDEQEWQHTFDVREDEIETQALMIISMCLISLIIVLSGYLLIYNVMYISVGKDIRFYGMLKTIGTSTSQIQKLIKYQTFYLSLIGIPIGLILGTIASFGLVPIAVKMVGSNRTDMISKTVTFHPGVYIFAICFAIFTVVISAKKPAKIASKVSPMEALRYLADTKVNRKYKTTKKNKVFSMAFRNVFRDKKKARLVFASLFMGSMMFLCVNTFIKALDVDSFVNSNFYYDYVLYADDSDKNTVGDLYTMDEFAQKMGELEDLDYFRVNRYGKVIMPLDKADNFLPFLKNGIADEEDEDKGVQDLIEFYQKQSDPDLMYGSNLIAADRKMIEIYNQYEENDIDIDRFEKGEICLIGAVYSKEDAEYLKGRKITLVNPKTGVSKEIEIGAARFFGHRAGLEVGTYGTLGGAPDDIFVSDQVLNELFPDAKINSVIGNAKKGKDETIVLQLKNLMKNCDYIVASDIRSEETKEFKQSLIAFSIIGDGISGILILIGLMNFINVMLTGVFQRANELVALESIGMTKKQIKKMLTYEGLIYGVDTLLLILTLGNLMVFGCGMMTKNIADYAVFHYPYVALVMLVILIMLICMIVPKTVYSQISKQTITDRLRKTA